jgi:hypothetical protein
MPDFTMTTTDRLAAIQNAAFLNLLKKAQGGKTLTATDWRELRRMAVEAGLAPEYPWMHDTIAALAAALGVTDRTLENWRGKGCPLPASAPFDELAVRLWHLSLPGGRKQAALSEPSPALAPYLTAAQQIRIVAESTDDADDPADRLKREQAQKVALQNAAAQETQRKRAIDVFVQVVGALRQGLNLRFGGQTSAEIWEIAQRPRAQSEPLIRQRLLAISDTAVREALASTGTTAPPAPAKLKRKP